MSGFRIGLVWTAVPIVVLSLVTAVSVSAVPDDRLMSFAILLSFLWISTAILLLIAIMAAVISAIAGWKEVAKGIGIGIGIGIVSLGASFVAMIVVE